MITYDTNLTRSELARELGVDRSTLWRYQRAGRLPAPTFVNGKRSEFSPDSRMIAADLVAGALA
jgi:predicted site-specific integrase-resolvase